MGQGEVAQLIRSPISGYATGLSIEFADGDFGPHQLKETENGNSSSDRVVAMIYQETHDNGFIQVRRNLLCHLEDGRLTLSRFAVFNVLLLLADSASGRLKTSSEQLRKLIDSGKHISLDAMRTILARLEKDRYITRKIVPGHVGIYEIQIHKFPITRGQKAGTLSNIAPKKRQLLPTEHHPELPPEQSTAASLTPAIEPGTEELGYAASDPSTDDYQEDLNLSDDLSIDYEAAEDGIEGAASTEEAGEISSCSSIEPSVTQSPKTLLTSKLSSDLPTRPIQEVEVKVEEIERLSEPAALAKTTNPKNQSPARPKDRDTQARFLALRYYQCLGRNGKHLELVNNGKWPTIFKLLLTMYSYDNLSVAVQWAFDESVLWSGHMHRTDQDPVEYFASKVTTIVESCLAEKNAQRVQSKNQAKAANSPVNTSAQANYPGNKAAPRYTDAPFVMRDGHKVAPDSALRFSTWEDLKDRKAYDDAWNDDRFPEDKAADKAKEKP